MNHKYLYLLSFLYITGCNINKSGIETYDDCIIENIKEATNPEIVETIKTACKQKFPATFDFEEIANKANVISWNEVVQSDEYKKHTKDEKAELRESYFLHVIEKRVHPDFKIEAKTDFESYAWGINNEIRKKEEAKTKQLAPAEKSKSGK